MRGAGRSPPKVHRALWSLVVHTKEMKSSIDIGRNYYLKNTAGIIATIKQNQPEVDTDAHEERG
jgi:hypothetical protein